MSLRSVLVAAALLASARTSHADWIGRSSAPGAVDDAALAERHARAFLAAHVDKLAPGARSEDFELAANVVRDGKRTVAFWQTLGGTRVLGGQLSVVIARDAIFAAQSQAVPFVALALGPEVVEVPKGDRPLSDAMVKGDRPLSVDALKGDRPLSMPTGRIIVSVDGRVRVADHRLRGTVDEYVGLDGRVLVREDRVRNASGTLAYDVPVRGPTTRMSAPAREANIVVGGTATTTDANGAFAWGSGTTTVEPGLVGPRVRVVNQAGALATATLDANDGQTTTWSLATDEAGDAQLSAFVHAGIAKAKARALLPSLGAWLDQPLDVFVNEAGGACNASSGGDGLHFFAGSAECENTARIADVVYHELGHALHEHAIIPGVGSFNAALSEGLADFFAASITGDSAIGPGYRRDERPVRELDPPGFEKSAPDDLVPSPHQSGLIIGGALWDLRRLLIAKHGEAEGAARAEGVLVGQLERAPNIVSSYMAALIGDDDDGDLGNGTPNKCEIDAAFARHGLAPQNVQVTQFGELIVDGANVQLPLVRPSPAACGEPAITGAELLVEGQPARVLDVSATAITGQLPSSGQVRFAIEIVFADGSRLHAPNNPADPLYTAFVGDAREIWCEHFDGDPQWTQMQVGSPSPWQVGAPQGLAGDPSAAFTGDNVLGTQLGGDGRYAAIAQTQISTPPIDVANYAEVRLQFRRWLVIEDAMYDDASIEVNGTSLWSNASGADGFLTHQDREWRFVDHDITAQATGPITITWKLASDASRSLGGWNIDDVCIVGRGKTTVCGDNILDDGEECDDTASSACNTDCTIIDEDNCCSVGANPRGALMLVLGVGFVLSRRRGGAARASRRRGRSRCACRSTLSGHADRPGSST